MDSKAKRQHFLNLRLFLQKAWLLKLQFSRHLVLGYLSEIFMARTELSSFQITSNNKNAALVSNLIFRENKKQSECSQQSIRSASIVV